jgi:5,10-methenyltetrahydrofolate synthetase
MRQDLIARRQSIPVQHRKEADARLAHRLAALLGDVSGLSISLYWPFRGEPDLRPFTQSCRSGGATMALPIVARKAAPLIFREWTGSESLERGVWNIPIPPAEARRILPDIVIAPVVGVDAMNFRLGYGGGFFDRTLADLKAKKEVLAIGVGYEMQRMPTIHPHEFDIAMAHVFLEDV